MKYEKDTTWVCPAGVRKVTVHGYEHLFQRVAAGQNPIIADKNGVVLSWGANLNGQIGDNSVVPKSTPVLVVGSLVAKQVASCGNTSMLLTTDGKAYGWGLGSQGLVGDNGTTDRSSPVLIAGGFTESNTQRAPGWKRVSLGRIAGGDTHALALNYDGRVYSWGNNSHGQRGVNTTGTNRQYPSEEVLGDRTFKEVGAGSGCSFAIDENDDLYAWGINTAGQLGDGTVVPKSTPVLVVGGLKWLQVVDQFGITTDGTPYAWGENLAGEIGDGTIVAKSSPTLVAGGLKFVKIASILSDVYHTRFGITQDGTLYAWGHNANGQIGDGSITSRSSPVAVAGTLKFTDIGSGGIAVGTASAAVGVSTDGAIYAWGTGINGQLGNNTVNSASSPTLVLGGRRVSQDLQVPKVLVDVTPGQSYAIVVNAYFASFGGVAVGRLLKGIVLEY